MVFGVLITICITTVLLQIPGSNYALLKKTIESCPKHNRNVIGLMVIMGIVLFLMETIMVSIGM